MRNPLPRLLTTIKREPYLLLPLLATLLVLATTTPLWGLAMNQAGDDLYHVGNEGQIALALAEGKNPFGPVDVLWGMPLLRFYQCAFYLTTAALHVLLGVPIVFAHNVLVVLCFAFSPWALFWAYRRLRLGAWTSACAALAAISSVAAFGNSFEAYFQAGIVTQAFGAVGFPLFMGLFVGLLRGERGPLGPAACFALTFVSHAAMALYAVFAGCLLFFCDRWPLKKIWKRLAVFSVLAFVLSAFWVVPFLVHQYRYKAEPDQIMRGGRSRLYQGVTDGELTRLVFSGRLLDDARHDKDGPQDRDDRLMDQINIMGTLITRPPVFTVLALLGFLLALRRFRSTGHRFLVTGFSFTLLLFAGPDHVPWLRIFPFISRVEVFRCVYLLEFFAFGLAGLTVATAGRALRRAIETQLHGGRRTAGRVFGMLLLAELLVGYSVHVAEVSAAHMNLRNMKSYDQMMVAARRAEKGFPQRIIEGYNKKDKKRPSYMAFHGLRSICGHWRCASPWSGYLLCTTLSQPDRSFRLSRKLGIGYILTGGDGGKRIPKSKDDEGQPVGRLLKKKYPHHLFRARHGRFLAPAQTAVLVVASDTQWLRVVQGWIRVANQAGKEPPLPVRANPDTQLTADLLAGFDAVWVLDPERLPPGAAALAEYAKQGGLVVSPAAGLPGIETRRLRETDRRLWDQALAPWIDRNPAYGRERRIKAERFGPYDYQMTVPQDGVVMLPQQHTPGWQAEVDGAPVEAFAAGPDFVGVRVPAGKHRLHFRWEMVGLDLQTAVLSAVGWVGVLGVAVVQRVRRRRRRS